MLLGDNPKFLKWAGYLGAVATFALFILLSSAMEQNGWRGFGWKEYAFLGSIAAMSLGLLHWAQEKRTLQKKFIEQQEIRALQAKVESHPEKAGPAWELARVKLESYFDRNLDQVRSVFYVAVVVMLSGFLFVLWGIRIAVLQPTHVPIAVIASASGIITQFIGLTFMMIYRSTMAQANRFMSVLERINTVGMAVQILDSMSAASPQLKDETRVAIIKLLLGAPTANTAAPAETAGATGQDKAKTAAGN